MSPWLKTQRRSELMAARFPQAWEDWLRGNVRHYGYLTRREQARVRETVQVVVAEKTWVGGGGFSVSDEMKVTVAGQAAVLALGMEEPYFFDGVQSIILLRRPVCASRPVPGAVRHPRRMPVPVYGEAWHRGPIVLSWREVLADGRGDGGGRNLVLHEFAHYIDGLDGDVDGSPPLAGREQPQTWYRVTEAEYLRLVGQARRNEVSLLDHYGASNRAEFFAVATECFFERPRAMQREHEELYGVLRDFYRQDPARWLPDADVRPEQPASGRAAEAEGRSGEVARHIRESRLAQLRSHDADTWFMLAVTYMDEGRYALAARAATRAIELAPDDAEAYGQRAMARVARGRHAEALADCDEALRLDPEDLVALCARGAARLGLGQYERAKEDLERVLAEDKGDADARYYRGRAWAGLGNLDRAFSDLSRSAVAWPLSAEVHYHLGLAYQASGDHETAEIELAKARQLDPDIERKNV